MKSKIPVLLFYEEKYNADSIALGFSPDLTVTIWHKSTSE